MQENVVAVTNEGLRQFRCFILFSYQIGYAVFGANFVEGDDNGGVSKQ